MNLEEAAEAVRQRVSGKAPLGGTLKFALNGAGAIFIDGTGGDNAVSLSDGAADCTVSISLGDFEAFIGGSLQPVTAYMEGKIKVDGDMEIAMRLSQFI